MTDLHITNRLLPCFDAVKPIQVMVIRLIQPGFIGLNGSRNDIGRVAIKNGPAYIQTAFLSDETYGIAPAKILKAPFR